MLQDVGTNKPIALSQACASLQVRQVRYYYHYYSHHMNERKKHSKILAHIYRVNEW